MLLIQKSILDEDVIKASGNRVVLYPPQHVARPDPSFRQQQKITALTEHLIGSTSGLPQRMWLSGSVFANLDENQ